MVELVSVVLVFVTVVVVLVVVLVVVRELRLQQCVRQCLTQCGTQCTRRWRRRSAGRSRQHQCVGQSTPPSATLFLENNAPQSRTLNATLSTTKCATPWMMEDMKQSAPPELSHPLQTLTLPPQLAQVVSTSGRGREMI